MNGRSDSRVRSVERTSRGQTSPAVLRETMGSAGDAGLLLVEHSRAPRQ